MVRLHSVSLAVLVAAVTGRAPAADPIVSKADLGDVTGTVVKAGPGSITLKVPTVTQTGVTRKHVGGRHGPTVAVPKYGTKQVETSYTLAPDVVVKTAAGKSATLGEVATGKPVRLHVYRVTERTPGEQPVSHVEVRRIDIPDPPAKQ
jgi:hypothetical protein